MGKFYHYTNQEGYEAIRKSKKIKKSKTEGVDAVFGYGVYLTSLSPQDRTNRGIANNNYDGSKDKFARRMLREGRINYWFEFDIPKKMLENCQDLDPNKRDIWLLKDYDLDFNRFSMTDCGEFEDFGKEEDPILLAVFSDSDSI